MRVLLSPTMMAARAMHLRTMELVVAAAAAEVSIAVAVLSQCGVGALLCGCPVVEWVHAPNVFFREHRLRCRSSQPPAQFCAACQPALHPSAAPPAFG